MRIPKMSGVIADFVSKLLDMPDEPSSREGHSVASYLEAALGGSIAVESHRDEFIERFRVGNPAAAASRDGVFENLAPLRPVGGVTLTPAKQLPTVGIVTFRRSGLK
jgi:hypothetical protein